MLPALADPLHIDAPMFVKGVVAGVSGRPVMGHSGEGRLLSGHDPAVCCGDGTARRYQDSLKASGHSWASPVTAFLVSAAVLERFLGRRTV